MNEEQDPGHSAYSVLRPIVKDVYGDTVKPVALELGDALGTVGRALNACLLIVRVACEYSEHFEAKVNKEISRRFAGKESEIVTPSAHTVIPALNGLRLTMEVHELRELYLNLLSSSLCKTTANLVHPSFAEIIRQLTPDEAKLLTIFEKSWAIEMWHADIQYSGDMNKTRLVQRRMIENLSELHLANPSGLAIYIDNLLRLGLVQESKGGVSHVHKSVLEKFLEPEPDRIGGENSPNLKALMESYKEISLTIKEIREQDSLLLLWKTKLFLSDFGRQFYLCCVSDSVAECTESENISETFLLRKG